MLVTVVKTMGIDIEDISDDEELWECDIVYWCLMQW